MSCSKTLHSCKISLSEDKRDLHLENVDRLREVMSFEDGSLGGVELRERRLLQLLPLLSSLSVCSRSLFEAIWRLSQRSECVHLGEEEEAAGAALRLGSDR